MLIEKMTINRLTSRGFFICAIMALLALCFTSCKAAPSQRLDGFQIQQQLKVIGRYAPSDTGLEFGWPGSGIELSFEGRWLDIEITDGGAGIMDITVDGIEQPPLILRTGTQTYRAVKRNVFDRSPVAVAITRRTEVFDTGLFTISAITTDGQIIPTPPKDSRKILFIGDSITAGFGVRGTTKDCVYNPATNHPRGAFAALTADIFNADYHLIAISGRGVVHNWDANPAPVMPTQIDFALPDDTGGTPWDHTQFIPDVVVITLGTNDWSENDPGREAFRNGYSDMLIDIRARFPAAHIVTAGGPLLDGKEGAAIRDGIDFAMADLSDDNISTLDFTLSPTGIIWGCNSHPGQNSMQRMARDLAGHIANQKTWAIAPEALPPIAPPAALPIAGKNHFKTRVTEIDRDPIQDGGVMLIGDSITEGWRLQDGDGLGVAVTNHGVGWDSTEGVLARLPQMKRHNPDKIFIMIGTNDISWGVKTEMVYTNLEAAINQLSNAFPEAEIYLQSIVPREADRADIIKRMNARYAEIAVNLDVHYIDLWADFAAVDNRLNPELTEDGLHLNAAGYRLWAKILKPYIDM